MRRSSVVALSAALILALTSLAARGADSVADQNKAKVRKFYEEVFSAGKVELADQYITADAVDHEVGPGQKDPILALPNVKAFITEFRKAFPDFKAEVKDIVAEGDKVVARVQLTGTHKGEFMGMAATGNTFSVECIDIIRLTDGKCVEHWGMTDMMSLMQQLKIAPMPPGK